MWARTLTGGHFLFRLRSKRLPAHARAYVSPMLLTRHTENWGTVLRSRLSNGTQHMNVQHARVSRASFFILLSSCASLFFVLECCRHHMGVVAWARRWSSHSRTAPALLEASTFTTRYDIFLPRLQTLHPTLQSACGGSPQVSTYLPVAALDFDFQSSTRWQPNCSLLTRVLRFTQARRILGSLSSDKQ